MAVSHLASIERFSLLAFACEGILGPGVRYLPIIFVNFRSVCAHKTILRAHPRQTCWHPSSHLDMLEQAMMVWNALIHWCYQQSSRGLNTFTHVQRDRHILVGEDSGRYKMHVFTPSVVTPITPIPSTLPLISRLRSNVSLATVGHYSMSISRIILNITQRS